jgi:hypothetical protein
MEVALLIVRSWHGIVPQAKAGAYRVYLLQTRVVQIKAIPGNLGVYIYSQPQGNWEHFFMVYYWIDMQSVCAFAGYMPHLSVSYPEDSQFGLIPDPVALHYTVNKIPDDFPIPLTLDNL